MIILATNNSIGSSLPNTRKVLSKYLYQVSNDSYIGKISENGLGLLANELKKTIKKNTSVQIYKFNKNKYIKLFHIGNNDNFSDDIFSFKSSTIMKNDNYIKFTPYEEILKQITIISGLFHDIGKNNQKFQEKLRNKDCNKVDFIRHELISFIYLCQFKKLIINKNKELDSNFSKKNLTDECFFSFLSIKENLIYLFKNLDTIKNISINDIKKFYYIDEDMFNKNFLITSIFYLVLTHHKLSDDKINDKVITKDLFKEINVFNLLNEFENISNNDLQKNLTIFNENEFLEDEFLDKIIKHVKKLNYIIKNNNVLDFNNLFYYIPYLCRPVLITSDYMGSNDKEISTDISLTLANTKNDLPADRLITHLIKVADYCDKNFKLFYFNINTSNDLHSINFDNVNDNIIEKLHIEEDSFLGKLKEFQWQQDVVNKILINDNNYPTFSVIISETGTGKTRVIPKILAALNKNKIRYNLLLGLTSLTEQTYNEYNNIGLKKYVNCLIGGKLNDVDKHGWQTDGVFNDINKNFNFELIQNEPVKFIDNNRFFDQKEKSILQKPIIVSTIDHFISHGSLNRGSTTNLFLRSISSDLVLDEIDNYSNKQLNIISRLVFLAGLNGKNVIISSATTNNIIVENFYNIYQHGLKQYFLIKQIENTELNILFVSNFCSTSFIKKFNINDNNFKIDYSNFVNQHILNIELKKIKHTKEILDINKCDTLEQAYEVIFNGCLELHNKNFEKNADKNVSIGFVKFNLVENTIDFSKFLSSKNLNDIDIYIFCYHSKFTINDKNKNEKILNELKRKNKKLGEIAYFKDIIAKSQKKDILFIVSTSPIIEVGRDHDYDWAIIDNSTTEAAVQGPGRVRRHRNNIYLETNIYFLSKPISSIINPKYKQYYKSILNNHSIINNYDKKIFNNCSYKFSFINEEKYDWNINNLLKNFINDKILSNKYCLLFNDNYNDNVLKSCENIVLDIEINNNKYCNYLSQNTYIISDKMCLLSNKFVNNLYFRDKNKTIRLVNNKYFIDEEDEIKLTNIEMLYHDFNPKFVVNHFSFKENKSNAFNQLSISNNDFNINLKYSNLFGLVLNKRIKNIF